MESRFDEGVKISTLEFTPAAIQINADENGILFSWPEFVLDEIKIHRNRFDSSRGMKIRTETAACKLHIGMRLIRSPMNQDS